MTKTTNVISIINQNKQNGPPLTFHK